MLGVELKTDLEDDIKLLTKIGFSVSTLKYIVKNAFSIEKAFKICSNLILPLLIHKFISKSWL